MKPIAQTNKETWILIAEPDVLIRNFFRQILDSENYCVLTAADREEALSLLEQSEGKIRVFLSAAGYDGLAEHVQREWPGVPVVLVSEKTRTDSLGLVSRVGPGSTDGEAAIAARLCGIVAEALTRPENPKNPVTL